MKYVKLSLVFFVGCFLFSSASPMQSNAPENEKGSQITLTIEICGNADEEETPMVKIENDFIKSSPTVFYGFDYEFNYKGIRYCFKKPILTQLGFYRTSVPAIALDSAAQFYAR